MQTNSWVYWTNVTLKVVCLQFKLSKQVLKLAGIYLVNKHIYVNKFFAFVTSCDSWHNEGADADSAAEQNGITT